MMPGNTRTYWRYIIILLVAIGLLEIIKHNIFIILLFLQNVVSIGNLDLNGIQINRPENYLLESSYSVKNGSYYYGLLPTSKFDNNGVGVTEKYSYISVELPSIEVDFYFLKKNGKRTKLLIEQNFSNNNFFKLWECGAEAIEAKILPEKYSNKHSTLFIENKSVFILIKGDIAEIRKFKGC